MACKRVRSNIIKSELQKVKKEIDTEVIFVKVFLAEKFLVLMRNQLIDLRSSVNF